jgi:hypothetical protein
VWYAVGGDASVDASVGVHEALPHSMCCPSEYLGTASIFTLVSCCWDSSGCIRGLGACGAWALSGPLGVTRLEGVGAGEGCLYMLEDPLSMCCISANLFYALVGILVLCCRSFSPCLCGCMLMAFGLQG